MFFVSTLTVNLIFSRSVNYVEDVSLPRKGYKSITVTEKVHEEIKKRAQETNRTLRAYIEYLFDKDTVANEGLST